MEKLKVLVVDDNLVYRKILSKAVEETLLGSVAFLASNGSIALERMSQGVIDVVLLDVNMPEMDGIEALKHIKALYPGTEVIMISSVGGKDAAITLKALAMGAIDFIVKPNEDDAEKSFKKIKDQLQMLFAQIAIKRNSAKVERTVEGMGKSEKYNQPPVTPEIQVPAAPMKAVPEVGGYDLVVIASSTGGPAALEVICKGFTRNIPKPFLLVQHMPPDFTRLMAQSLDQKSVLNIIEGKSGDVIKPGQVIIAPGGYHMVVTGQDNILKKVTMETSPYVNGVRPAADVLFQSVAREYAGKKVLAVVLTGMGNDGMRGVAELKANCKCYCITQSEPTCVVYGMPKSVFEAGLSDEVIDLQDIAQRIQQIV